MIIINEEAFLTASQLQPEGLEELIEMVKGKFLCRLEIIGENAYEPSTFGHCAADEILIPIIMQAYVAGLQASQIPTPGLEDIEAEICGECYPEDCADVKGCHVIEGIRKAYAAGQSSVQAELEVACPRLVKVEQKDGEA